VDISRSVLVQRHRFKEDIITLRLRSNFVYKVDNFVNFIANFEGVWIHLFADFALKPLPIEWSNILILCTWWFFLFLSQNPAFQAVKMDKSNGSFAFACQNQWIMCIIFIAPTNSALNLVLTCIFNIFGTFDLHSLTKFLLIQFLFRKMKFVASEIFDSESNST